MLDTNMKMNFSMTNIDGKVDAYISVKDLIDETEYEACASGEDTEEVLTNLYSDLVSDIETRDYEDMDEEDYIDYLENRIEELEIECETLREKNQKKNYANKTKYYDTLGKIIEKYYI